MNLENKNGYYDIHTHILPGVDDGAFDMEETRLMLQAAYQEGIRTIVATPHYIQGRKNAGTDKICAAFQQVQELMKEQYPDMILLLGNEVYYRDSTVEALKEKQAFSLGGTSYVLVEFKVTVSFDYLFQAVRTLTSAGYRPVIAHMERYECLYRKEELVRQLIEAGAYLQINAESLLGGRFNRRSNFCIRLFAEGLAHFLGSDCHSVQERRPIMKQAVEVLERKIPAVKLEEVTRGNPQRMLYNKYI